MKRSGRGLPNCASGSKSCPNSSRSFSCGWRQGMDEKELVLKLGVEGGGATIYRRPVGSGGWQFHVEGTSMFLDENDDEDWRSWTREPVPTIRDALRSIAEGGSWVFFHPISVHPEYRKVVWELAQEI